eukprot:RCo026547
MDQRTKALLTKANLQRYIPRFEEENVDYDALLCMDDRTLGELLPFGPRLKLRDILQKENTQQRGVDGSHGSAPAGRDGPGTATSAAAPSGSHDAAAEDRSVLVDACWICRKCGRPNYPHETTCFQCFQARLRAAGGGIASGGSVVSQPAPSSARPQLGLRADAPS